MNSWNEIRKAATVFSKRWKTSGGTGCQPVSRAGSPCSQEISLAAQGILDARAAHQTATLADLYDPLTMPRLGKGTRKSRRAS